MGIDVEILDLAKTLIESFGSGAPKHAKQLAESLRQANSDRAMRYELAGEVARQLLAKKADDLAAGGKSTS